MKKNELSWESKRWGSSLLIFVFTIGLVGFFLSVFCFFFVNENPFLKFSIETQNFDDHSGEKF